MKSIQIDARVFKTARSGNHQQVARRSLDDSFSVQPTHYSLSDDSPPLDIPFWAWYWIGYTIESNKRGGKP